MAMEQEGFLLARSPYRSGGGSLERKEVGKALSGALESGRKLPRRAPVNGVSGASRAVTGNAESELAQPDVAEADMVPVVLESQRAVAMRHVEGRSLVGGTPRQRGVVLH